MDKNNIKTLQELVNASAEEYGDKVFVTEKAGKELVNKTIKQFREDVKRLMAYVNTFRTNSERERIAGIAAGVKWW